MKFVNPLTETLSITYNDITYTATYYKPPFTLTGVTDEVHPNWAVGTTYAVGDFVIVPELKRIYRSAAAGNVGIFPPSDLTKWVDWGNVNSYSMLATDENIGSVTNITDGVIEYDFSRMNTIAGVDLNFSTARVYLFDTGGTTYKSTYVAGTTYALNDSVFYDGAYYVSLANSNTGNTPDASPLSWEPKPMAFNQAIDGKDIGCLSFAEYFFEPIRARTRVVLTNLQWLANSVLRIEMDGASTIGTIVLGRVEDLGVTLWGLNLGYESTSRFKVSEFTGFRDVIRYGRVRSLDVEVIYDTPDFGIIAQKVDRIIDRNVIWIPTDLDRFSELITIGYIERFDIPLNNPSKTKSQTKIIGVSR